MKSATENLDDVTIVISRSKRTGSGVKLDQSKTGTISKSACLRNRLLRTVRKTSKFMTTSEDALNKTGSSCFQVYTGARFYLPRYSKNSIIWTES